MKKKKVIIIITLIVLVVGILGFAGYKTADYINQKNAEMQAIREMKIEIYYERQNEAFYDLALKGEYAPYRKEYEWKMQAHINIYTKNTGKSITLSDIETFLATRENPDGSPRTWVDDETGIIRDYVDWCSDNLLVMRQYRVDLQKILTRYCEQYPGGPYIDLSKLTPEQINKLDKKYDNPDYELVLE